MIDTTDPANSTDSQPPQSNAQADALAAAVAAATAAASAANAAASAAASAASAANTIISVVTGAPPQNFTAALPPPMPTPGQAGQNGRRNLHNYNPSQGGYGNPNNQAGSQVYHSYQAPHGGPGVMAALPAPFGSDTAPQGPYGQWKGQLLERGRFHAAAWDEEAGLMADGAVPLRVEMTPPPFFHLYASLEQSFARLSGYAKGCLFVGVTSAILGEGKTTVALHLALSAARATQKRVCLVDLSLGEDDLCRRMGAAPAPGGTVSLLEEKGVLGVMEVSSPDMFFIPAGKVPENPSQMARSKMMGEFFTTLRGEYDLVIADMPAVVTDNAVPLAALMDGVILVMQAGATPRTMATEAIEKLGRDRVAGVVLNRIGKSAIGEVLPTTRRDEAAPRRGGRN